MPVRTSQGRGRQSGAPDPEQTSLDVVLRCFASALRADTGMLLGYDAAGSAQLLSAWGAAERRSTVPWTSTSLLGRALEAEEAGLQAASESQNGDAPRAWSAVAAPILGPAGSLGAIYAGFEHPSQLDSDHLRWIASSHARLAALCLSGGTGVAAVLRSSAVDQLTGCLTYERILEMLTAEVWRSQRQGHALSLCFLDIDSFKAVNDAHGHLEGNRVLATAGEALRTAARPYDGVGRFGGDEFVIVLPETTIRAARGAAERMRLRMNLAVEAATGKAISASVGIAEWREGETMRDLLEASDRALQEAKAAGGGCVAPLAETRFDGLSELTRTVVPGSGGPRRAGPKGDHE